ncbi:TonB family protein [bacterium]|nr:TonB family protein [bacterium]
MTSTSIIGFKNPRADLHKRSPRILLGSALVTIIAIGFGLNIPIVKQEKLEKKVKTPPVIIQLENIPETRQRVTAPAPKLAMPLEVSDDVSLDDVTIDDTSLDLNAPVSNEVKPVIIPEAVVEKAPVEEEIFEFFAVEEQPERIGEVAPAYPEEARKAGVQGTVFVRALVGKNGAVEKAEVMKGPELLKDAAIQAAMKTTFKPAKQNDMPVKCWVQMKYTFELEQ